MNLARLVARLILPVVALSFAVLPAFAFQGQDGNREAWSFSAPEIEITAISSALLVVAGAALILRDRKARRQNKTE